MNIIQYRPFDGEAMGIELAVKIAQIITAAVVGAGTLWLAVRQHSAGAKGAQKEEYKFAKLFFEELQANPGMHRFARDKGFQAIGRNENLSPTVVEHLMTFEDPVLALADYESSRSYLKGGDRTDRPQLSFSSLLLCSSSRRRTILGRFYVFLAVCFYTLAFTPWLFFTIGKISPSIAISSTVVLLPIGFTVAVIAVREYIQLKRAVRLLDHQCRSEVGRDIDTAD